MPDTAKRCKLCDIPMLEARPEQKYCPDCAKARVRKANAERYREIKARAAAARHATKPKCGGLSMKTAIEISMREGISYGKVMEKYGG